MSAVVVDGRVLPWDDRRGTRGMALFITTEALLFVVLFFSYFYLGHDDRVWPAEPPKLPYALVMLGVLLSSSGVLHASERMLARRSVGAARVGVAATMVLGVAFLVLQGFEYHERLKTVQPTEDAYGSIFYAITGLHGAHVLLGLGILGFVVALPRLEPDGASPYRPLHNAGLYWHFVDAVWVLIVALLYLLPRAHG